MIVEAVKDVLEICSFGLVQSDIVTELRPKDFSFTALTSLSRLSACFFVGFDMR
jgi:hypothetical protein